MPTLRGLVLGLIPVVAAGCSSGTVSTLPPPEYDADAVAQAALTQLDMNRNGQIEGAELDACPALKLVLSAVDSNGDKGLSAAELKKRVELYSRQGLVALTCTITLDGKPLAGATVTFDPEPFLTGLRPATATTDETGMAGTFHADGRSGTGLVAGLYRIRVTKAGTSLPARYNSQSTLGREVLTDARVGEARIDLTLTGR